MQSSIASGLTRSLALASLLGGLLGVGLGHASDALAQARTPPAQAMPPAVRPPAPAVSDPRQADTALSQARRLFDEGRSADALAAIEVALQASPSDPRLRFLKGVILTREGRGDDAISVFRSLSQDFPELPEPYNNLAALYASRGQLDEARAALEEAIRALPGYALAQENLGDVYLRLAMRAWAQAARLDPGSTSAAAKLKAAEQFVSASAAPAAALPGAR